MSTQLVTVHGDGTVLLSLYCWPHNMNHDFDAADVERLIYLGLRSNLGDVGQPWCPAVALRRSHEEDYAAGVDEGIAYRKVGHRIPERHRDGPDQSLADLPDPTENTFDATADRDS